MRPTENYISENSDYYVHVPSKQAKSLFFYPLYTGRFHYRSGYSLRRESYDSFLLMYISSGSMYFELEDKSFLARPGSFVLLDCYRPHTYRTENGCEALWLHFDGANARGYYDIIHGGLGYIIRQADPSAALQVLEKIYQAFSGGRIQEVLMSKYITDILTNFCLYIAQAPTRTNGLPISDKVISYINEHFTEEIQIETLASLAGLSKYHFIRAFKKETGFTPHEYIINLRIDTAKYLLKSTNMTIRDLCVATGFSGESVFCSSFKKRTRLTPLQYRMADPAPENL